MIYPTHYRVIEADGKFQPQKYGYVPKKWWQRVKIDWYCISTNNSLWYDSIEEANKVIKTMLDRINKEYKPEYTIHPYHANS